MSKQIVNKVMKIGYKASEMVEIYQYEGTEGKLSMDGGKQMSHFHISSLSFTTTFSTTICFTLPFVLFHDPKILIYLLPQKV